MKKKNKEELAVEEVIDDVVLVAPECDVTEVALESKITMTPYLTMYYAAWEKRFVKKEVVNEDLIVEETPVALDLAPAAAPVIASKVKVWKKNPVAIIFAMIFALLAIVLAAISYFEVTEYANIMFDSSAKILIAVITDTTPTLVAYIYIIAIGLAVVAALCVIIAGIVALACKKRTGLIFVALVALIFALVSGLALVIDGAINGADILSLVNPMDKFGLGFGYYIILVTTLISFICSIFAYKKVKTCVVA